MKEQLRRCGCLQPQVTSHCRIRNTPGLRRLGRRCSAKCPPLRVVGKGEKPARHLWLVAPGEDQAVKGCGCGLQKGGAFQQLILCRSGSLWRGKPGFWLLETESDTISWPNILRLRKASLGQFQYLLLAWTCDPSMIQPKAWRLGTAWHEGFNLEIVSFLKSLM